MVLYLGEPPGQVFVMSFIFVCSFCCCSSFVVAALHSFSRLFCHATGAPTQVLSSRYGCISDASLRRLMQSLRDMSKRTDLQISEMYPVRCIKGVSSETSLRSLRSSQRRLGVASESVIRFFQTEPFFGYLLIYLPI